MCMHTCVSLRARARMSSMHASPGCTAEQAPTQNRAHTAKWPIHIQCDDRLCKILQNHSARQWAAPHLGLYSRTIGARMRLACTSGLR